MIFTLCQYMSRYFSHFLSFSKEKIGKNTKFKKHLDKSFNLWYNIIRLENRIAELCKGSTADSDSVCLGSNPSSAAKRRNRPLWSVFSFDCGTTTFGRRDTAGRVCLRLGEVSRLCIPPSAVSCHARTWEPPYRQGGTDFAKPTPSGKLYPFVTFIFAAGE